MEGELATSLCPQRRSSSAFAAKVVTLAGQTRTRSLISSWATHPALSSACMKSPAPPAVSPPQQNDFFSRSYDGHGGPQVAALVRAQLPLEPKHAKPSLPHALCACSSLNRVKTHAAAQFNLLTPFACVAPASPLPCRGAALPKARARRLLLRIRARRHRRAQPGDIDCCTPHSSLPLPRVVSPLHLTPPLPPSAARRTCLPRAPLQSPASSATKRAAE